MAQEKEEDGKQEADADALNNTIIRIIRRLIFIGDSLSDRGWLNSKYLFHLIPFHLIAGLDEDSPDGRFTNGYCWADDLLARIALVNKNDPNALFDLLSNPAEANVPGFGIIKTYCIGGATAGKLTDQPLANLPFKLSDIPDDIKDAFTREIVTNLTALRKLLFADDAKTDPATLAKIKAETLIIEWVSGANDLITVNLAPTEEIVGQTVDAKIQNLQALIDSGYRNFFLPNLPDLSLVPRFHEQSNDFKKNMLDMVNLFNQQLQEKCAALEQQNPDCKIVVFDVCSVFRELFADPEKYGFEKDKINSYLLLAYEKLKNYSSDGYASWDGLHPTAKLASIIAGKVHEAIKLNGFQLGEQPSNPENSALAPADEVPIGKEWSKQKCRAVLSSLVIPKEDLAHVAKHNSKLTRCQKAFRQHMTGNQEKLEKIALSRPEFRAFLIEQDGLFNEIQAEHRNRYNSMDDTTSKYSNNVKRDRDGEISRNFLKLEQKARGEKASQRPLVSSTRASSFSFFKRAAWFAVLLVPLLVNAIVLLVNAIVPAVIIWNLVKVGQSRVLAARQPNTAPLRLG